MFVQDHAHLETFMWYMKFDLVAALTADHSKILGLEWYTTMADVYKKASEDRPHDIGASMVSMFANLKLLTADIALLLRSNLLSRFRTVLA